MKTIYFAGDSHTCGTIDTIDFDANPGLNYNDINYTNHLAFMLGYKIIGNTGRGGASNSYIWNKVEHMLWQVNHGLKPKPDFVVVGWSEYTRQDWFYEDQILTVGLATNDIEYYSQSINTERVELHAGFPHEKADEIWPERADYTRNVMTDLIRGEGIRHFQQNYMYNLHQQLQYLNIPHLFFNAHLGFCDKKAADRGYSRLVDNNEYYVPVYEFDWDNCFWNPYDEYNGSYVSWAQNQGLELTDGNHVVYPGAKMFARVLYDHIQEHGLIKTTL